VVFAKETDAGLTSLVKKVEAAVAKNKSAHLHAFVVMTSDAKGMEERLKKLAESEKIEQTVLTIDNPGGPEQFKLADDADVTVVLYVKKQVKASHAFKGPLTGKDIDQALADLPKILPEKKSD
jgi:hypothetical protein